LPVENLETEERAMNQGLDKIVCSAAAKMQFRTDVKKITKKVVKYKKGLAAKLGKEALAKADVVANEVKESGEKFRVLFFDFAADGKISKKVLTAMTKIHDVPYMIVAVNTAKNNISCFSSVGKSHHEKIDASKWCNALKDKFGGRGGGKPTNSQWSGDLSVGTDAVVAMCKEFAASSLA
jgi:alanyl-tRNA synthetase